MFESTANAEVELRAVMAERLKASMAGDTEKIASSLADSRLGRHRGRDGQDGVERHGRACRPRPIHLVR